MNQHDLNQEIADATGESTATIEALGFSLLFAASPPFDRRRQTRQQASAQRGKGAARSPSRPKRTKSSPHIRLPEARQVDIQSPADVRPY